MRNVLYYGLYYVARGFCMFLDYLVDYSLIWQIRKAQVKMFFKKLGRKHNLNNQNS